GASCAIGSGGAASRHRPRPLSGVLQPSQESTSESWQQAWTARPTSRLTRRATVDMRPKVGRAGPSYPDSYVVLLRGDSYSDVLKSFRHNDLQAAELSYDGGPSRPPPLRGPPWTYRSRFMNGMSTKITWT